MSHCSQVVAVFVIGVLCASGVLGVTVGKVLVEGELLLSDKAIEVLVSCTRVEPKGPLHGHTTASWPCVVSEFSVTVGGNDIEIPTEAYQDLANPLLLDGLSIQEEQDGFRIFLFGGDGENAYEAEWLFSLGALLRRTVTESDGDEKTNSVRDF